MPIPNSKKSEISGPREPSEKKKKWGVEVGGLLSRGSLKGSYLLEFARGRVRSFLSAHFIVTKTVCLVLHSPY